MMRQLTCADTGLPVIANTLARTVHDRDRSVVRLLEKYALASCIFSVIDDYANDRGLSLRQAPALIPRGLRHAVRPAQQRQTRSGHAPDAKAHRDVDDEAVRVHNLAATASNVADVTQIDKLLHGSENVDCAETGYNSIETREEQTGRQVICRSQPDAAPIKAW